MSHPDPTRTYEQDKVYELYLDYSYHTKHHKKCYRGYCKEGDRLYEAWVKAQDAFNEAGL